MPIRNINYQNTIIYKIVCNDLNVLDLYVGSTTDFTRRKSEHKSICNNPKGRNHNYKIYQTIRANGNFENWSMIELEKFPCNDHNESLARERYYYELLNANLNAQKPSRTKKEYSEDTKESTKIYKKIYRDNNKEMLNNNDKIYYEKNKESIKLKNAKKYNCVCGITELCHSNKGRHEKSKIHLLNLANVLHEDD